MVTPSRRLDDVQELARSDYAKSSIPIMGKKLLVTGDQILNFGRNCRREYQIVLWM
ncbi:MAG: hypothetical protein ACR2OE_13865 [Thermomicrobiales bacterium]